MLIFNEFFHIWNNCKYIAKILEKHIFTSVDIEKWRLLQRYKDVVADILKYLMPSKIERDLKQLHKDTVESVAVNK